MPPTNQASRLSAGALILAAVLVVPPMALADTTVVRDRKGDTAAGLTSYLDIRKATAGHARGGRLKHVVQVQRASRNTAHAVQVHLRVGKRKYRIYGQGVGTVSVFRVVKNGSEATGTATVRRRGKRISFVFDRSAIGSPGSYRWAVAANPNPGIFRGKSDRAPERGFRRHRLPSSAGARAAAKTRRCGSLQFTPMSGDALVRIRARGISCRRARSKLRAWRRNNYRPATGPRGYRCRSKGPGKRSTCRRKARRLPVISYLSGT